MIGTTGRRPDGARYRREPRPAWRFVKREYEYINNILDEHFSGWKHRGYTDPRLGNVILPNGETLFLVPRRQDHPVPVFSARAEVDGHTGELFTCEADWYGVAYPQKVIWVTKWAGLQPVLIRRGDYKLRIVASGTIYDLQDQKASMLPVSEYTGAIRLTAYQPTAAPSSSPTGGSASTQQSPSLQ